MVYAQPPESVRLWLSETTSRRISRGDDFGEGVSRASARRALGEQPARLVLGNSASTGEHVPKGSRGLRQGTLPRLWAAHTRAPAHLVEFEAVVAW